MQPMPELEQRAWESSISAHLRRRHLGPPAPSPEQLVLVFADRVWRWQLDIAERVMNEDEHGGFAALSIGISYLEMIGMYLEGYEGDEPGKSKEFFTVGFRAVTDGKLTLVGTTVEDVAERLYKLVRCGLYHDGLTRAGIVLRADAERPPERRRAMYTQRGVDGTLEIVIDPKVLIWTLQDHFAGYVAELLRGEGELRNRFVRRMKWVDA